MQVHGALGKQKENNTAILLGPSTPLEKWSGNDGLSVCAIHVLSKRFTEQPSW